MAINVGIGKSKEIDSFGAGALAARAALDKMGQSDPDIIFCFASSRFDHHELLRGIKSISPQAPFLGCSTAGEITSEGPDSKSVVILALKSDRIHVALGIGKKISGNSRSAGQEIARDTIVKTRQGATRHAFMMFPDGLKGNSDDIIRGIQEVLGTSFPIVGGAETMKWRPRADQQSA